MPASDEQNELRALQRRAYGRGGGLTDAEAARLRELEHMARPAASEEAAHEAPSSEPVVAPLAVPYPGVITDVPRASEARSADSSHADITLPLDDAPEDASVDPEPATSRIRAALGMLRGHWRFAAVASVLLLAIGVGAGWMLFWQGDGAISLTAEQQQRRLELYDLGDYDEGSLRAVGQDAEGALVWYGTKIDGEQQCVVIDVGEESGQQCVPRGDSSDFSISTSVTIPGVADSSTEVVSDIGVSAFLLFSTTGEPMVSIQRWEQTDEVWLQQFVGEERTRAEELMADDAAVSLSIIGDFRDAPVWLLEQFTDTSANACLVVDAVGGEPQCLPSDVALRDGISSLVFVDDGAGGSEAWTIQVAYTVSQTPYLVITRDPTPASVTFSEFSENDDSSDSGGDPTG